MGPLFAASLDFPTQRLRLGPRAHGELKAMDAAAEAGEAISLLHSLVHAWWPAMHKERPASERPALRARHPLKGAPGLAASLL